jgi:hypothetical protein
MSSWYEKGGGGPAGNEPQLQTQTRVQPGNRNLLAAVCDVTGSTVIHEQGSLAAYGGWTPDLGCARGTASFSSTDEMLPMLPVGASQSLIDGPAMRAFRLHNGANCTLGVSSPYMPVESGRTYVLRGWLRSTIASSANLNVTTEFLRWAPLAANASASASPLQQIMATPTEDVGYSKVDRLPRWEPLLLRALAPADAGFMRLRFEVGVGASTDIFAPAVN